MNNADCSLSIGGHCTKHYVYNMSITSLQVRCGIETLGLYLLLTWTNFNPSIDKYLYPSSSADWIYLFIAELQRLHLCARDYLSIPGLELICVRKSGLWSGCLGSGGCVIPRFRHMMFPDLLESIYNILYKISARFLCALSCFGYFYSKGIYFNNVPKLFRVTSLAKGQSYDEHGCPSVSDVNMKDTTINPIEHWTVC